MADFHPRCPKCDQVMSRGHIPDMAHGQVLETGWAPGEPEARRFIGGIRYDAKVSIPLHAYRCPECGYIEFYARPD